MLRHKRQDLIERLDQSFPSSNSYRRKREQPPQEWKDLERVGDAEGSRGWERGAVSLMVGRGKGHLGDDSAGNGGSDGEGVLGYHRVRSVRGEGVGESSGGETSIFRSGADDVEEASEEGPFEGSAAPGDQVGVEVGGEPSVNFVLPTQQLRLVSCFFFPSASLACFDAEGESKEVLDGVQGEDMFPFSDPEKLVESFGEGKVVELEKDGDEVVVMLRGDAVEVLAGSEKGADELADGLVRDLVLRGRRLKGEEGGDDEVGRVGRDWFFIGDGISEEQDGGGRPWCERGRHLLVDLPFHHR
jgi:hypothetical protein